MNQVEAVRVSLDLLENPIPLEESSIPEYTREDYEARINALWQMPQAAEYDAVIIYGDREHFSNIHYFTGYDPRWEESLLILRRGKEPYLLVGNEGIGYVKKIIIDIEVELYQIFSLMGQPNQESRTLFDVLSSCLDGVTNQIGLIGFKTYDSKHHTLGSLITDVPHYIVETLREVKSELVIENATDLLADCSYGLKHSISPKDAVHFEAAGTKISRGVYQCLKNLSPGMTEMEAGRQCGFDGSPANMHPNINFGDENVSLGLNSPTAGTTLSYGNSLGVGYGLRGSLVHKCGMYIRTLDDLPEEKQDYMERILIPYFNSLVSWYEMMKIGTSCGNVYTMVDKELGLKAFGCTLNPGHLTHTDEWTNSPFYKGSKVKIKSGMAIQCDYTVTKHDPFMSVHVEDGFIIADETMREKISLLSPSCMERIQARRKFITRELGINLPQEVLPLSDLGCICFPYMADLSVVMKKI